MYSIYLTMFSIYLPYSQFNLLVETCTTLRQQNAELQEQVSKLLGKKGASKKAKESLKELEPSDEGWKHTRDYCS